MLRRLAVSAVLMASLSQAALVRIEVKERSDAFTGYERVIGRAFFAVDPSLPANRIIVDIDKAPRNAEGQVEFSSDIYILKPKDPRAGNGSVLFEVSNRGGKGMLGIFNRGYVQVYDSALGQLVLILIVALYAAGFIWIRRLARFDVPERLLRGPSADPADAGDPVAAQSIAPREAGL